MILRLILKRTDKQMNKLKIFKKIKKYQDSANKSLNEYAKDNENWRYLEVIITLLSITFFIVFAIRPTVITIADLVGEINEKKELTQQMQQKIDLIIIAQNEFALVQGSRDLLESYLPTKFAISQGIAQMAGASMNSNLPVKHVSVSSIDDMINPTRDFSGLEFDFSSDGNYQELRLFLGELDSVRRWVDVNRFQIKASEERDHPPGFLNFNFRGQFNYWFEETYGQE